MSYSYVNPHFYRVRSDEKALLFRGSWTPFNWVEKYNYAFSGPYHKADVALTFDDGPDSTFTPAILDVLKKYGVKATFFLLGRNIKKYPELVERIAKEGHAIGIIPIAILSYWTSAMKFITKRLCGPMS